MRLCFHTYYETNHYIVLFGIFSNFKNWKLFIFVTRRAHNITIDLNIYIFLNQRNLTQKIHKVKEQVKKFYNGFTEIF